MPGRHRVSSDGPWEDRTGYARAEVKAVIGSAS